MSSTFLLRPCARSGSGGRFERLGLATSLVAVLAAVATFGCRPQAAPPVGTEAAAAPGARHLLLVTVDTLRADRVGAFGDVEALTPVLDRLATRGTAAELLSSSPLTLPSHASLMTARWPHELGVRNNGSYVLAEDATTLAEALAAQGVETAAFVSSYVLARRFGIDQGFAHYDDRLLDPGPVRDFRSEIPAADTVSRFRQWIEDRDASAPFFAWVHFYEPHQPWAPPEDLRERFADDPYRGEVAEVDRRLGDLLATLEAHDLLDETLVAVTSDHGEGFGEHLEVGHGIFAYDEMLRVPLVLAGPGIAAGRRLPERLRLLDIAPTLLELLGAPTLEDATGSSFARRLAPGETPEPAPDPDVYFESLLGHEDNGWAPVTGVVHGPLKYIALPEPELYDLAADPAESTNLAAERRGDLRRLDARLRELLLLAADAVRRTPDAAELAALEALGYAGTGSKGERGLDPKIGMRVDRELREVQDLLASDRLDAAAARLLEIREAWPEIELVTMFWLEHGIAAARGATRDAVAALEAGRKRFPEVEQLGLRLARYLVGIGRPAEGAEVARQLLERSPVEARARIALAEALAAQDRSGEAIDEYLLVLAAEPSNVPVALTAAELMTSTGRWPEAREVLLERLAPGALETRPEDVFRAGLLAGRAGDAATAESLLRRGLALDPSGPHHLALGLLLARQGRMEEARSEIRIALEEYGDELPGDQRRLAAGLLQSGAPGAAEPGP